MATSDLKEHVLKLYSSIETVDVLDNGIPHRVHGSREVGSD